MSTQPTHHDIDDILKKGRIQVMRAYLRLYIDHYKQKKGPNWARELHKNLDLNCLEEELKKQPELVADKMDFNQFTLKIKNPDADLAVNRVVSKHNINTTHMALFEKIRITRNNVTHANGRNVPISEFKETLEAMRTLLKAVNAPETAYLDNLINQADMIGTPSALPKVGNRIDIGQVYYTVRENTDHGGKSIVLKIQNNQDQSYWALKCLNNPENLNITDDNDKMSSIRRIPGFEWTSDRKIITYTNDKLLVKQYNKLHNAILMPWLKTPKQTSWFEFKVNQIQQNETLRNRNDFIHIAYKLVETLKELEERGFAHGDINTTNVIINMDNLSIHIIDIEDMFHNKYILPMNNQSAGTPGYQFRSGQPVWHQAADRFAGALLICEMLCWNDIRSQNITRDEYLFDQQEEIDIRDTQSQVYKIFEQSLQQLSPDLFNLFEACWQAKKIDECPQLADWYDAIEALVRLPKLKPEPSIPNETPQPVIAKTNKSIPQNTERPATSDTPVLVYFLLDHSTSMIAPIDAARKRHDAMYDIVHEILFYLLNASMKSNAYSPRYHVGIITYGKSVHNFLADKSPTSGIVTQSVTPYVENGIWQIKQLCDTMGFRKNDHTYTTNDFLTFESVRQQPSFDGNGTNIIGTFQRLQKILTNDNYFKEYNRCAPPYVIHITDGCSEGSAELFNAFDALTELTTGYGNLLVSTIFVGQTLLRDADLPRDMRDWPGVTDKTSFADEEFGRALRQITSKIPLAYLNTLQNSGYAALKEGSHFFFPSNNTDMIKLAITAAMATVSIKKG
jgi:serine/threonine protein kinase